MKTFSILLAICFMFMNSFAQEQTIFDNTEIEHGGFGAPVIKFTSVNDEFGVLMGGRGGWIINHTISIGFGGYGLVNNVNVKTVDVYGRKYLEFGYGGLELEYIANSNELIHCSINTLIGGGSVGFRYDWEEHHNDFNDDFDNSKNDSFFIVEPGFNLDLNVTSWFRTSAGVSYRYVKGLSSAATTNNDIRGLSAGLTFRFGKF